MAMTDQKARSWHHYYKNRQIFVLKWTCSSAGISPTSITATLWPSATIHWVTLHYGFLTWSK